jgi:ribosomal protein S18 acetylase RimI-like enzyme
MRPRWRGAPWRGRPGRGSAPGRGAIADLDFRGNLGRFQTVETHPGFRQRGYAGTLVYQAARHTLGTGTVETLVLVADADSAAERLYRSVGFLPAEQSAALERW